ncbi:MAG: hypothetical protein AAF399_26020, partial [Bacteroidota bacterium]
ATATYTNIISEFVTFDVHPKLFVSIISEIELLGFRGLSEETSAKIEAFLAECYLVELTPSIRRRTIQLRKSV